MIMKRNTVLKVLNPILLVLFISQAATGLFHAKLSHETFELLHEGGGILLIVLVAIHLTLNLNWIRANYFHK